MPASARPPQALAWRCSRGCVASGSWCRGPQAPPGAQQLGDNPLPAYRSPGCLRGQRLVKTGTGVVAHTGIWGPRSNRPRCVGAAGRPPAARHTPSRCGRRFSGRARDGHLVVIVVTTPAAGPDRARPSGRLEAGKGEVLLTAVYVCAGTRTDQLDEAQRDDLCRAIDVGLGSRQRRPASSVSPGARRCPLGGARHLALPGRRVLVPVVAARGPAGQLVGTVAGRSRSASRRQVNERLHVLIAVARCCG